MNAAAELPDFTGIAVHDAWTPYYTYPRLTQFLCNAHVLRQHSAVTDHNRAHAADPDSWCWAVQVIGTCLHSKSGPRPDRYRSTSGCWRATAR